MQAEKLQPTPLIACPRDLFVENTHFPNPVVPCKTARHLLKTSRKTLEAFTARGVRLLSWCC